LKLIDFHLLRWSAQQRLFIVLGALASMFKTSSQLRLENLALRQQLAVLRRSAPKRLKLTPADRIFRVWLLRVWGDSKSALMIVKAEMNLERNAPKSFPALKRRRVFWRWRGSASVPWSASSGTHCVTAHRKHHGSMALPLALRWLRGAHA
jgi:hypothetical protein